MSDHAGWAVLVTTAGDGCLLDRRRVDLVDKGLPKLPHHHEAQMLSAREAVALIKRVRASAHRHAKRVLDDVAATVAMPIRAVAIRQCPSLPRTLRARLEDYRAQNVADTVMYRQALASAARARGWPVYWYDAKKVLPEAGAILHIEDLEAHFLDIRKSIGPPWAHDHRIAMAAAIVAAEPRQRRRIRL